jgi:hypothetical protein
MQMLQINETRVSRFFKINWASGMLIIFMFLASTSFLYAQSKDVITNKTIIDLKKAGISKEILKSFISCANCNFETDATSILKLNKAGVDDEVIIAMTEKMNGTANKQQPQAEKTTATATATTAKPATSNAVISKLKQEGSGIYYKTQSGITELDPTVYSQTKNSGAVLRNLSGGFAKSTTKVSLSGGSANAQLDNGKPVFYFVFNSTKDGGINSQAPLWFTSATSPNEFMLIKFITGKNKKIRDVVVASGNDYSGTAQGVDENQKKPFKYNKLENGLYEIYFEEALEPGEYCFMYAGSMSASGSANPKVYDFGVK